MARLQNEDTGNTKGTPRRIPIHRRLCPCLRRGIVLVEMLAAYDQLENFRAEMARLEILVENYLIDELKEQIQTNRAQLEIISEQIHSLSLTESQLDTIKNQLAEIKRSQRYDRQI